MALSNKKLAAKRAKKKANRNKKSPNHTFAQIQPAENQNNLIQNQENTMFNKNTPVIDFDNDHDNFWGDEDASIEIAKNVFKNAIALTQLVAEKDESIRSKKQIFETYEEAFIKTMTVLEKMK